MEKEEKISEDIQKTQEIPKTEEIPAIARSESVPKKRKPEEMITNNEPKIAKLTKTLDLKWVPVERSEEIQEGRLQLPILSEESNVLEVLFIYLNVSVI